VIDRIFKISVSIFCAIWVIKNILLPVAASVIYSSEYAHFTKECAEAMDSAWHLDKIDTQARKSASVQLLACHEYDKIRKKMLILGLPEDYLSYLQLRSLGIHQRTLESIADQHRFIDR